MTDRRLKVQDTAAVRGDHGGYIRHSTPPGDIVPVILHTSTTTMYMYTLLVLSVVAAVSAVTPFFESPHNEKAAAFYKVPVNRDFSSPFPVYTGRSQPSYKPQSSYKSDESFYSPEPSFYNSQPSYYKSEPSYYKSEPSYYKSEPSFYKSEPSFYKSDPSYYRAEPSYKSEYGHGATSYQTMRRGGDDYNPQYRPQYKPQYNPQYKPYY